MAADIAMTEQHLLVQVRTESLALQLEGEPSPTKAGLKSDRKASPGKRRALFSPRLDQALAKKSARTAASELPLLSPARLCIASADGEAVSQLGVLHPTVQEEVIAVNELRPASDSAELACVAAVPPPLPPLALAKELPECIRAQLQPTPLDELLRKDRRLAAAVVVGGGVPEGTLMLRMSQRSGWVQRMMEAGQGVGVALLRAPSLEAEHTCKPAQEQISCGAAVDEEGQLRRAGSLFEHATIPDLEVPRAAAEEESLRKQVLELMWADSDMLQPAAWDHVDR
ncbi:hypothetical protein N2152v2_005698 [Parachlorella kessleri]